MLGKVNISVLVEVGVSTVEMELPRVVVLILDGEERFDCEMGTDEVGAASVVKLEVV